MKLPLEFLQQRGKMRKRKRNVSPMLLDIYNYKPTTCRGTPGKGHFGTNKILLLSGLYRVRSQSASFSVAIVVATFHGSETCLCGTQEVTVITLVTLLCPLLADNPHPTCPPREISLATLVCDQKEGISAHEMS